jgi:Fic family protein
MDNKTEREYQKSHHWLTFNIPLDRASPRLWTLLGEAYSKCEHIAGVPLSPDIVRYLHRTYLVKGALASTAIEGNSLTVEQAMKQYEGKLELPLSKEYLAQELDNIIQALTMLSNKILSGEITSISTELILQLNGLALQKLVVEPHVIPGKIRNDSIGVGRYKGVPAKDCEYLLNRLCELLKPQPEDGRLHPAMMNGIIPAIVAHLYIAWIHPFGDGNGRTSRLVEFCILMLSGVPTPAAHLLSNYYNETRPEYYRQLAYASESGGDILAFIEYALTGFVEGLTEQIKTIRVEQWTVAWRDYIQQQFKDKLGKRDIRRCNLVTDLSEVYEPVAFKNILTLTPRLAKDYAKLDFRTLKGDLQELRKMGLVEIIDEKARARREVILAFLPERTPTNTKTAKNLG